MAGELGLLNNYRTRIYEPLRQWRGNEASGGHDGSVVQFMRSQGMTNAAHQPVTMDDLWCDLGLNPNHISLDNIITLSGDLSYFAVEVVREFIIQGLMAAPWWQNLCTGQTVEVAGMSVVGPWIQYSDTDLRQTGEVETIAEADLEWGNKTVTIYKKAKGLRYSDEVMFGTALPFIQPFLQRVGIDMAASMNNAAVTTLVNGDQTSGDECAQIGVRTQGTLDFLDFVYAWARGNALFYNWHTLVTPEAGVLDVFQNEEFTQQQGVGGRLVNIESVNRVLPGEMPHMVSSGVAANNILLVDPRLAMIHLQFMPLRVEDKRIAERQMTGTYVSIIDGFYTIDRRARLLIDKSQDVSGADFPAWMTPLN